MTSFNSSLDKTRRLAPLVANHPPASSTTDNDTHPLCCGDYMIDLIFGCIKNRRNFIIRESQPAPLYIAQFLLPIMQFKNYLKCGFIQMVIFCLETLCIGKITKPFKVSGQQTNNKTKNQKIPPPQICFILLLIVVVIVTIVVVIVVVIVVIVVIIAVLV